MLNAIKFHKNLKVQKAIKTTIVLYPKTKRKKHLAGIFLMNNMKYADESLGGVLQPPFRDRVRSKTPNLQQINTLAKASEASSLKCLDLASANKIGKQVANSQN